MLAVVSTVGKQLLTVLSILIEDSAGDSENNAGKHAGSGVFKVRTYRFSPLPQCKQSDRQQIDDAASPAKPAPLALVATSENNTVSNCNRYHFVTKKARINRSESLET